MTQDDDRLDAALAWCRMTPLERAKIAERATASPPAPRDVGAQPWSFGPSVTMRLNRYAHDLAVEAWPDANVRKLKIAELIVIAAKEEAEKRGQTRITQ